MTAAHYFCAATVGHEFAVAAALAEVGIEAWVARQVFPVKPPGEKVFHASQRPLWPGYVFAVMDAAAFFEARHVRHLHKTKLQMNRSEVQAFSQIRDTVDAEAERARREIKAGTIKSNWTEGQQLEVIDGPFKDRLASFALIIERSGDRGYRLQVYVDGMPLPLAIDPASVRVA